MKKSATNVNEMTSSSETSVKTSASFAKNCASGVFLFDEGSDGDSTRNEMNWKTRIFGEKIAFHCVWVHGDLVILHAWDFCLGFVLCAHTCLCSIASLYYLPYYLTSDPALCRVVASCPRHTHPILALIQRLEAPQLLEV